MAQRLSMTADGGHAAGVDACALHQFKCGLSECASQLDVDLANLVQCNAARIFDERR